MSIKSTKQYLYQAQILNQKIRDYNDRLDELRSAATSISCQIEGERVQTSSNGGRLEDLVIAYVDMAYEIEQQKKQAIEKSQEIIDNIHKIDNAIYIRILSDHYVNNKLLKRIADDIGYNYSWLCELHGNALQEMDKVLNNRNKPN